MLVSALSHAPVPEKKTASLYLRHTYGQSVNEEHEIVLIIPTLERIV